MKNPEINLHSYGQLIYDKGAKNIQYRKNSLFHLRKPDGHMQKNKTRPLFYILQKINSMWV